MLLQTKYVRENIPYIENKPCYMALLMLTISILGLNLSDAFIKQINEIF